MPTTLNNKVITQSIVFAVFDLTDRNGGNKSHVSLHISREGAASVVATRQEGLSDRAKSMVYFELLPVLP